MTMMDGDPVEPNDRVWDRIDGAGTVQAVYSDSFTVRFNRRVRKITYAGVMDGRRERTVFWAPNDLFVPRKNPALYKKQVRAIKKVMEIVTELAASGPLVVAADDE